MVGMTKERKIRSRIHSNDILQSYKNASSVHHSQIEEESFRWKVGSLHEILAPNSVQKQAANGAKTRSFWSKVEPSRHLQVYMPSRIKTIAYSSNGDS
jgi:hypothetical protein